MSLPSTREKAAIVELLSLEDAAAVLTELRLRGDYDDVLAALLPGKK
jgi:microcompartment protein CcmL/EutN